MEEIDHCKLTEQFETSLRMNTSYKD